MEIKRGIAVSPGVAIGPALVVDTEGFRIPRRSVERAEVEDEITRLRAALANAALEAREIQKDISAKLGKQYGAIFAAHALLIEDPELVREVEQLIRTRLYSAAYAVSQVMRRHAKALANLDHPTFSTRSSDLFDIEKCILRHVLGDEEGPTHLKEAVIILAHDLTPSETAALDPKLVYAFATEAGGRPSRRAIMPRVREI